MKEIDEELRLKVLTQRTDLEYDALKDILYFVHVYA